MPYAIKRRTATVTFEDTEYDGATMRCRFDVEMGIFLAYQRVTTETNVEAIAEILRQFGEEILLEWDLTEEDGTPLPATGDGMMKLPLPLAGAVVARWLEAMANPSVPLVPQSKDGSTSAEDSTPTETPSPSPAS